MHLKECLLDYGPPPPTVFGAIHLKGTMGYQLMKKFVQCQSYENGNILSADLPREGRQQKDYNDCNLCMAATIPLRLVESFALKNSVYKPLKPFKIKPMFSELSGQHQLIYSDLYEPVSACSFLPAQRILEKCAHVKLPIDLGSHTETLCCLSNSS